MSDEISIVARQARDKRCCVVIVNQLREKVGVMFGDTSTTPGGHAPKFQAFHRLQMWRAKSFDEDGRPVGHRITIKAIKNKAAMPNRKASIKLDYRHGFDNEWSTIQLAKDLGLVPESAKLSAQTLKQAVDALAQHEGYYKRPS